MRTTFVFLLGLVMSTTAVADFSDWAKSECTKQGGTLKPAEPPAGNTACYCGSEAFLPGGVERCRDGVLTGVQRFAPEATFVSLPASNGTSELVRITYALSEDGAKILELGNLVWEEDLRQRIINGSLRREDYKWPNDYIVLQASEKGGAGYEVFTDRGYASGGYYTPGPKVDEEYLAEVLDANCAPSSISCEPSKTRSNVFAAILGVVRSSELRKYQLRDLPRLCVSKGGTYGKTDTTTQEIRYGHLGSLEGDNLPHRRYQCICTNKRSINAFLEKCN